jgi:hypothetical protein
MVRKRWMRWRVGRRGEEYQQKRRGVVRAGIATKKTCEKNVKRATCNGFQFLSLHVFWKNVS